MGSFLSADVCSGGRRPQRIATPLVQCGTDTILQPRVAEEEEKKFLDEARNWLEHVWMPLWTRFDTVTPIPNRASCFVWTGTPLWRVYTEIEAREHLGVVIQDRVVVSNASINRALDIMEERTGMVTGYRLPSKNPSRAMTFRPCEKL